MNSPPKRDQRLTRRICELVVVLVIALLALIVISVKEAWSEETRTYTFISEDSESYLDTGKEEGDTRHFSPRDEDTRSPLLPTLDEYERELPRRYEKLHLNFFSEEFEGPVKNRGWEFGFDPEGFDSEPPFIEGMFRWTLNF